MGNDERDEGYEGDGRRRRDEVGALEMYNRIEESKGGERRKKLGVGERRTGGRT